MLAVIVDDRYGTGAGAGASEFPEDFGVDEPDCFPEVNARSLASLSRNDGLTTEWPGPSRGRVLCNLDRPGATKFGWPLRRGTTGSGGRRCSSIRERGACLTRLALLFNCLVGTASTGFLFVRLKMLLFFFSGRGSCGRSYDQTGAPSGSEEPMPPLGEANLGVSPPIFLSNEAYRCFVVGLSRGSGIIRRSVTNLALCLARSELMPSRAILSFSASSSTAFWTRCWRSQYTSYQQSGRSGRSYSSHLGISLLMKSSQSSASSSMI